MTSHWDEFSISLAEAVPRRESLRRLGVVLAGAVLSPLGLNTALAGGDPCKAFCRCSHKKQQNACLAACRACNSEPRRLCGTGCGNYFCCGAAACCGDYCADLATDGFNCGGCGDVCEPPGPYEQGACIDGECRYACVPGAMFCDGACTPVNWDPDNCGDCGVVCAAPTPYCNQGTCSECAPGTAMCAGRCMSFLWDNANCGACGVACPYDTSCIAGFCQYQEPYWGDGTY